MSPSTTKLFEPLKVGNATLQHRVVLAPLTRCKASSDHVPYLPLRASTPGSLLISEATSIAARAGGAAHTPGIWSTAQIKAWKVPMQLQKEDPSFPYVSASDVPLKGRDTTPRPLTVSEIEEYVVLYAQAAKNAIEADFDGVEIHNASGYLPDQFLNDSSNKRTDGYGGSIEKRARFTLEVVDAIVTAIGAQKTAIRFSPWSPFQDMTMADPLPTFSYVISKLAARHSDLAYIHLIEPRITGGGDREAASVGAHESNDALRALWAPRPLIRAGGFTREEAIKAAESGDLVAFGRLYISNPDLPNSPRGYTDQPLAVAA
ncbi:hypothetical protein DFH07DRAFT_869059 [Mycena maculata]|uniref:NADH:flavin oxidoreductase/NADH oxidase N-terminal domain-containing protein n=1 Tax=Mycena maculata TaxID=230809 RepID=A0AAD7IUD3_9AGAR|nr:hypothetical protein DFH07DRAFT_869059 [Mycena maculata]